MRPNLGDTKTRLCKVSEKQRLTKSCCASGGSNRLHEDGEPGISTVHLQTILFSAHVSQQVDRITAFSCGTDSVLVYDTRCHCSCHSHICRHSGGAFYQNEASFFIFLLTRGIMLSLGFVKV